MSGKATIEIIGQVARDPEMRYGGSENKPITTFSIPVQERREAETVWYKCVAFDKQAELLNEYATKGKWLVIRGTPKIETWDDKNTGEKRFQLVVTVRDFTFCGGGERDSASEPTQNTPARPTTQQKPAQQRTAPARNVPQRLDDSSDLPF